MTKNRLEAFSDGVIAIIITIMVIEIRAPHDASWHSILKMWPVLVSYPLSFLMLGIYWGNHHHLIHTIKEVKGGILWANLHLLFWLSLVPFVTAWMGENHFSENTVAAYAIVADLCGIAYYILLLVMKKCNPGNTALLTVLNKQSRKGTISCILYTVAIPLAYLNTMIAGACIVMVAIMWLIPDRNIEKSIAE